MEEEIISKGIKKKINNNYIPLVAFINIKSYIYGLTIY